MANFVRYCESDSATVSADPSNSGPNPYIATGQDAPGDTQGRYGGKLSNGGERLTLQAADGAVIRQIDYEDWYVSTDGEGASLIIVDAFESDPLRLASQAAWRPSDQPNGSPGIAGLGAPGDFDDSGVIDINDVDLYYAETMGPMPPADFDLTGDALVDNNDLEFLIVDVLDTRVGDTNLDGRVDFVDFLVMSLNFGKEDRSWGSGDFDADGTIGFADFLAMSQNFGFAREA